MKEQIERIRNIHKMTVQNRPGAMSIPEQEIGVLLEYIDTVEAQMGALEYVEINVELLKQILRKDNWHNDRAWWWMIGAGVDSGWKIGYIFPTVADGLNVYLIGCDVHQYNVEDFTRFSGPILPKHAKRKNAR